MTIGTLVMRSPGRVTLSLPSGANLSGKCADYSNTTYNDTPTRGGNNTTGEKRKNMEHLLTLSKCAYLFGNRPAYDEITLRKYYDDPKLFPQEIPYTINSKGRYIIQLNGKDYALNDHQIARILDDPDNIINHRKEIKSLTVPGFHQRCTDDLYHDRLSTLHVNFFEKSGLNMIRVHFKNNYYDFIVDNRNGDIYNCRGVKYAAVSRRHLADYLGINGKASIKAFNDLMDAIQEVK